jgi:hypothetical protein
MHNTHHANPAMLNDRLATMFGLKPFMQAFTATLPTVQTTASVLKATVGVLHTYLHQHQHIKRVIIIAICARDEAICTMYKHACELDAC